MLCYSFGVYSTGSSSLSSVGAPLQPPNMPFTHYSKERPVEYSKVSWAGGSWSEDAVQVAERGVLRDKGGQAHW